MTTITPATQTAAVAAGSGGIGFLSSFVVQSPSEVALITALIAAVLTAFLNYEESRAPAAPAAPK